jgi:hypothetical protein
MRGVSSFGGLPNVGALGGSVPVMALPDKRGHPVRRKALTPAQSPTHTERGCG